MEEAMNEQPFFGDTINANISGNIVDSHLAIGHNIAQQSNSSPQPTVTAAELTLLHQEILQLKAQIELQALPEQKAPALERVAELEAAVITEKPDLSTMEYVRNWFVKNIPTLAGKVTGVVVNPIVGKLVEAAGETLAEDFRHRFGQKH